MPYTEEHTKETLSRAYVTAVAGMAGASLANYDRDFGVDGSLLDVNNRNGRYAQSPFRVDYQLKASTKWELDAQKKEIIYDLEAKNYNDMAARDAEDDSLYLFLLCLPKDAIDWLNISDEQLIMKNCCYWFKVTGDETANSSTVRIRIPTTNILNAAAVQSLLTEERRRRRGQFR